MQNRVHAAEQRKEGEKEADQVGIGDGPFSSPLSSVSLSLSGRWTEQSRRGRSRGQDSRADKLSRADGAELRGAAVCVSASAGFQVLRRPLPSSSLVPFPLSLSQQMRWDWEDTMGIGEPLAGDVCEPQLLFPREQRCSSPHAQLNPFPFPRARSSLLSPRTDRAALSLSPFPSSGVRLSKSDALATTFGPRRRHMRGGRGEDDAMIQKSLGRLVVA